MKLENPSLSSILEKAKNLAKKDFIKFFSAFVISVAGISHASADDTNKFRNFNETKTEIEDIKKVYQQYQQYVDSTGNDTLVVQLTKRESVQISHITKMAQPGYEISFIKDNSSDDDKDGKIDEVHKIVYIFRDYNKDGKVDEVFKRNIDIDEEDSQLLSSDSASLIGNGLPKIMRRVSEKLDPGQVK